ncbi:four helix bundle protein [Cerasicoccus maritimus]|uniref:four helix bundle protein n=1 Tax=Cerasicoccus maritimus TaxID=490089 RepID=UPI002852BE86|nr:four helix bundle protein [Cerasicoccus maritimus]
MGSENLQIRTKTFALRILKLVEALSEGRSSRIFANQIGRCACSVAANYRAACRAKSKADFIAKLGIVEEEADETLFWLEMIRDAEIMKSEKLEPLMEEANELIAITVSSINTARGGKR